MTTANINYDPLAAFAIRLPVPGQGSDFAAEARAEIERHYGPDVAADFAAAYRDNDKDAAARVVKHLAGGLDYSFSETADRFVGQALSPKGSSSMEGVKAFFKSEAHFQLQFAIGLHEHNAPKKALEDEHVWTPPAPRFPELKRPKIF
jgi:hypothetical protein